MTGEGGQLDDFEGLLDWPRLNAWIQEQEEVPGTGPVTVVTRLAGGLSNNVFLMERGGAKFVLRRPPKKLRSESNTTMLREARILKALKGTSVPRPEFHAVCEDDTVIGACFYIMAPLEGFSPLGELKGEYGTNPAWRRAMGEELVRAAAALSTVDAKAVGLGDLGRTENWHERQAARWKKQLDGYREIPGYAGNELPHIDTVGTWLNDNLPSDRRMGLIHGDFQFPNLMFSLKAPKVAGIIDWELASQGDPMLDMGWILSSWWEDGDPPEGKKPMVLPWDGFMSRAELSRLYCQLTGRDIEAMPWFFALACYKLACVLEGTHARSYAGQIPAETGKQVHAYTTWLMKKAMQVISA